MATTITAMPLYSLHPPTQISTTKTNQTLEPNKLTTTKDIQRPNYLFKSCNTLTEVKQLHAHTTKTGQSQRLSDITSLISKCTQIGSFESLQYANKALELFILENGVMGSCYMFNALIRGYNSGGLYELSILAFHRMVCVLVTPDKYTFPFMLSACAKGEDFGVGVQVHGLIAKMGFERDVFVMNSLIHFYGECGKVDDMRKVFVTMLERNVVSWTSLIDGYVRRGFPKEAVFLFHEMVELGEKPNTVTMVCAISACAKLQDLVLGERVCAYIGEFGMELNTVMVNAIVDMYMKCGAVDTARQLFHECSDKNLVLCNTIMSNYVRLGMGREALAIISDIMINGLGPDRVTMQSAVSACSQLGDILCGKVCHGYIWRNALEGWDNVGNVLIDMYMKCGNPQMACRVFDGMRNRTLVSWNSLIAGFVRNGDVESAWKTFNKMTDCDLVSWNTMIGAFVQESMFEEAIELFRVMQNEGIKPDKVTMVGVASACGYVGALELARWIHAFIEKYEIQSDMWLGTALVDMFARCGDTQSAMQVFDKMMERDVLAWTAAIGALAMEGNGKQAVELFNEMIKQGLKPDRVVFVGLLTALSHSGLVELGQRFFQSMESEYGITPEVVHYGCMVDMLGRAGLLREALQLVESMPVEPNEVICSSLLSACRLHNDLDIARLAAETISELNPNKTGIHVLLSNIYASAGEWGDVAKVRLHMKEKGARKSPGSSSTEVDGKIYEFTCGDESHPEMTRIQPMLKEVSCRLRDAGHVPDLTNVLLDVDEEEKEYLLSRHSEKMAIAFSLISTSQGMPIRIVKNIRICSDCHSFAKFVSKVYNREITIRDNNRFHFFRDGFCSCNNYW